MGNGGSRAGPASSCPSACSHGCSGACFGKSSRPRIKPGGWRSSPTKPPWPSRQPSNCLAALRKIEWVVYAKRPFGGSDAVLAYLSRYTHRIAIANSRLVAFDGERVTFKWKDYRAKRDARYKRITLDADEFIRRFLIHVLPDGLHRIRHYGLFANGGRADNIARVRQLLSVPQPQKAPSDADGIADGEPQASSHPCPCWGGRMIIIEIFERGCSPRYHSTVPNRVDSS